MVLWTRSSGQPLRLAALALALLVVPLAPPAGAAESDVANIQFEATIPAPVVALAASSDARHILVMDEQARFTFIPDAGGEPAAWQAPNDGALGQLDPALAEIAPVPIGAGVSTDGQHWAGAVAYEDNYPGRLYGFARWSDEPIWTYSLPQPGTALDDATQPTVLRSAGPYHALGTTDGKVLLFQSASEGGTTKTPYRTYKQDNEGNAFSRINDVAFSRDGKLILIGTDGGGVSSVHLFSDIFFQATFHRVTQPVERLAMDASGTRGAVVTGTGGSARLHLLDLQAGRTLWETTIGDTVTGVAFSANGQILAAGTAAGRVAVFHERGTPFDRDPVREYALSSAIAGLALADRGDALAVATDNGRLHFLDTDRALPLWTYAAGTPLVGVALAADDEALAFAARTDTSGRVAFATAEHAVTHVAPPAPRALPGQVNTLGLAVGNSGNRMETIHVAWKDVPSGWEGQAANVSLAPGEQAAFDVRLFAARGQAPGTYPVRFDLVTDHERIEVRLDVNVPQVTSGRTNMLWQLDSAVPDGAPAAFLLQLENTGNTPNDVALGYARLPAGWRAEFTGPTELDLRVGEDRSAILKVWAPRNAAVGRDAQFDLVMAWKSGEERIPLAVRVLDAKTYYGQLTRSIDGGGIEPSNPLAKELEAQAQADMQNTEKGEKKGSPGVAVLVPVVVLVGVIGAMRRRRA